MTFQRDRLGTSNVFKAIVESARRMKRALSEVQGDVEPTVEALELADRIGSAFIAGRYGDVYALGTAELQRTGRDVFEDSWRDAVAARGPLTEFEVSSIGAIDLGFIPGLEEVPQDEFVAFLEIAFASPHVPTEDEDAFVLGAVLLDRGGALRVGALHTR